jgi:glycogen synthase
MSVPERNLPHRVLMTADAVGGVWTFAVELAAGLSARGVDVCLATMGPRPTADQREQALRIPRLVLRESSFRLEWMEDPWDDVGEAGTWLEALCGEFVPDVVHLNQYAHADLPWSAPVVVTAHSCVLSWWRAVHGCAPPASWSRYRERVAAGLAAAQAVVAPTAAMLGEIRTLYAPPGPLRVISNGREPALFRRSFKEPIVLSAGRLWDPAKNIAALDRIANRLLWPVYVAGETTAPDGGSVARGTAVRLGNLAADELASWYARAGIFALPARYEPFGFAPLEAAFSGCALVLGDIPTLREVWGDAAAYVPPDDTAGLVATVRSLIADPRRRLELADRARHRAARYVPERTTASYLEIYAEARQAWHGAAAADLREVM